MEMFSPKKQNWNWHINAKNIASNTTSPFCWYFRKKMQAIRLFLHLFRQWNYTSPRKKTFSKIFPVFTMFCQKCLQISNEFFGHIERTIWATTVVYAEWFKIVKINKKNSNLIKNTKDSQETVYSNSCRNNFFNENTGAALFNSYFILHQYAAS